MKRKNNQNKMVSAALALLLVGASLLIAGASSASRRAKAELEAESTTDEGRLPFETAFAKVTPGATESDSAPEEAFEGTDTESGDSEEAALTVEDIIFTSPLGGSVISACSLSTPVYSLTMNDYRTHSGVDISASLGDAVLCCADGTVTKIWDDPMMGTSVSVSHGAGLESVYKNLAPTLAEGIVEGASLSAGQAIGSVGESALIECEEEGHLHLELKLDGQHVDPAEYIKLASANEVYEDISDP